jgi:colicin import membrane protein
MMQADGLLLNGGGEEEYRKFIQFLAISAVCHIVIFLVLVFAKTEGPVRRIQPAGVINVGLVSLPASSGSGSVKKPKVENAVKTEPVKKENTTPKQQTQNPPVKVATVPKKKKIIAQKKEALKKETQQSTKTIDNAIDEMKKKVEQSQNYQKTMERFAEQVEKDGEGEGNGGPYGAGGFSGPGSQQSDLLTIYAAEIYSYISKNWSYNEQLADGNVNLVALLGIKIMADGEIQKVWFDKKSGNGYFDEQALKAVLKTRYLPPLPEGFRKPFLEIGLRFTPSGIQ